MQITRNLKKLIQTDSKCLLKSNRIFFRIQIIKVQNRFRIRSVHEFLPQFFNLLLIDILEFIDGGIAHFWLFRKTFILFYYRSVQLRIEREIIFTTWGTLLRNWNGGLWNISITCFWRILSCFLTLLLLRKLLANHFGHKRKFLLWIR